MCACFTLRSRHSQFQTQRASLSSRRGEQGVTPVEIDLAAGVARLIFGRGGDGTPLALKVEAGGRLSENVAPGRVQRRARRSARGDVDPQGARVTLDAVLRV